MRQDDQFIIYGLPQGYYYDNLGLSAQKGLIYGLKFYIGKLNGI